MKRVLSLAIAAWLVVMMIPFALLMVAAEEGESPSIVGATLKGSFPENDKNRVMTFQTSNPGTNIYDGKIDTDAQSEAYKEKANAIKNSYFDADGKYGYEKNEAVDGGYYHVIFLELNVKSAVDTLHLWADSGRQSEWAGPNGYDIWYSVDGETYTNSGLSFSEIRNETEVNPEIYVDDTFNGSACIAHHIAMGGVEAKYIAIAVTDFAYGSGSGQSIIYEATVDGTLLETLPVKFNNFEIYAHDGDGNPVNWAKDSGADKITDGILHEDNFAAALNNTVQMTPQVYFDGNGTIAYLDEASDDCYYGVAVAELNSFAVLNTLTVWSPNSLNGEWIDNVSYDIYYSVDGETFSLVEGATIEDSREALVGVDVSEFPGEATVCNDAGVIYKNEINMNGVIAKYVAIAVKQPIPHSDGRAQIVFYELTVDGTATEAPELPDNSGESTTPDNGNGSDANTGNDNTGNDNTGDDSNGGGNTDVGNENNSGNTNTGNENTNTDNETTNTETNAPETEASTAPETEASTAPESEAEIVTETEAESGCGASLAMTGIALVGTCAAVLALKRKRNEEN